MLWKALLMLCMNHRSFLFLSSSALDLCLVMIVLDLVRRRVWSQEQLCLNGPACLVDTDVKNLQEHIQAETSDHVDFELVALLQALILQLLKIIKRTVRVIKGETSSFMDPEGALVVNL